MTAEQEQTAPAPHAAQDSIATSWAARRRKQAEGLYKDLLVPRYDPPLYLRVQPVPQPVLNQLEDERAKEAKSNPQATMNYHAKIVARAGIGVFDVDDDGKAVGDPSSWPRFDAELAARLEVPFVGATQVVRALYLTDGDVVAVANAIVEYSGYADEQLARERRGE